MLLFCIINNLHKQCRSWDIDLYPKSVYNQRNIFLGLRMSTVSDPESGVPLIESHDLDSIAGNDSVAETIVGSHSSIRNIEEVTNSATTAAETSIGELVEKNFEQSADELQLVGESSAPQSDGPSNENQETEPEQDPTWLAFASACQSGDLVKVKEMISSGEVSATSTSEDGITGLHWAAINNRLSVVKYLVENEHSRADVNRLGGKLAASPLHWACRGGLVYVVDYLLSNTDADPSLKDSQNYNALHLAILSSNITLITYVILRCVVGDKSIYIDDADLINCTPLHWAAYQGDILSVNILLKYGADVSKVDKNLMTPLHWAFIRGSKHVLAALEEAGSDIFAKNDTGKDSFAVSKDMNCEATWQKVLEEADRNPKRNWEKRTHLIPAKTLKIVTFLTPYILLPIVFHICSFGKGYAIPKLFFSILIVVAAVFLLQKFAFPVYMPKEPSAFQSPLLSGIFSGTAFWCFVTFFFAILPKVLFKRFFTCLVLIAAIGLITYCFYKSATLNPGNVPIPTDTNLIFQEIKELIAFGNFDTQHFCINTFIRKPLRSKYSRVNKHLVARFDHYCPWVYNEVGVRNHKVFITFVYSLVIGIFLYINVAKKYFDVYAEVLGYDSDLEDLCLFLSDKMCLGFSNNHFIFNLSVWSGIQCIWVLFLAVTQTFQILKGLTTVEFSKLNKSISSPSHTHSTVPRDFQSEGSTDANTAPPPAPSSHDHARKDGFLFCMKLLGLDQFFMTIKVALLSLFVQTTHSHQYSSIESLDIPTDFGWKQNWLDFWFIGETHWRNLYYLPIEGENNLNGNVVDYYKLYNYPAKHTGLNAV